jgi:hypothetical protein
MWLPAGDHVGNKDVRTTCATVAHPPPTPLPVRERHLTAKTLVYRV